MASIQPNGHGFRVVYRKDGKQLKSPTVPTREAADLWMRDHLPAAQARSILALVDAWRDEVPSTHRTEAALVLARVVTMRGWLDPTRLTAADLHTWTLAHDGFRRPLQYLLTVLRWAAVNHGAAIRPEVLAWKPKTKAKRKPRAILLTEEQVQAIRDCAGGYGPKAFAVIDYLATYAARPITACRLTMDDLDPVHGRLTIPDAKHSGGWRHLLMPEHVDKWMALERGPKCKALFPHYKEDRAWKLVRGSAGELNSWFRNTIRKKLKLRASIYDLKRYAITTMLARGIDPATVAEFSGHLDLQQVLTYAASNEVRQGRALGLMAAPGAVPSPVPVCLPLST
jgi:integrase